MQVREAVEAYRYAITGLSQHTQEWYIRRLLEFATWCECQNITLERVKPLEIRKYLAFKRTSINPQTKQPIKDSTLHTHAEAIKVFLNFCSKEEELEDFVSDRTIKRIEMPKVEETAITIFNQEEIRALFEATRREGKEELIYRDRAILSVLLDTGIRASELCNLTIDCCYLEPYTAFIRVKGKGRKERELSLGTKARQALHRYIARYRKPRNKNEKRVFLNVAHMPLTRYGLDDILDRLSEWSLVKDTHAHKWRHTFSVNYYLKTRDIYALSRSLGHSSVAVTEKVYLRALQQLDVRQNGLSVLDTIS